MAVTQGTRIGPYEAVEPIGAGGMGEVWKARDTRLDRLVAIKAAKQEFSDRFNREARAIAALNHPNICTLHDVGPDYLVMEYVDGPTLEDRIRQGAVPLVEAMEIARQIAAALEAAHEAGIVHRDLKPANIKIRPDGSVKVLDFGLAKVGVVSAAGTGDSPTLTVLAEPMMTQAGVVLGTAQYMSPEQARGKPVDRRADIWAFGVVLYEMLTGRHAFTGETTTDVLASVVKDEPDLSLLPAHVRPVIARCLSKDPRNRWRDARDVVWALEQGEVTAARPTVRRAALWPWLVAAILAAALPLLWILRSTPEQPLLQFEISAPEGASLGPIGYGQIAVSPDGNAVVFPMIDGTGKRMLCVRALSVSGATPLAGSDDGQRPFWSPDSRFVGFFARGKVYKANINGGPEQAICDWPKLVAGTWGPDGTILLGGVPGTSMPLHRVSSSGGTPAPIMPLDTSLDETSHRAPYFLPDGKHFLFATASNQPAIYYGSLDDDGRTRRLLFLHGQSTVTYVPKGGGSGWILFGQGGRLMARPFDPNKGHLLGDPLPVADSLRGGLSWSASANGILAFRALRDMTTELVWFDREGRSIGRVGPPGISARFQGTWGSYPMLSPDEKLIAMTRRDQGRDHLWVMDIARGITTRITPPEGTGVRSVWSRDGTSLFYAAPRRNPAILVKRADAAGSERIVAEVLRFPTDVSPDGRWLVTESNARDVVLMPLAGGKAITFSTDGRDASFSPDGRWIVYTSENTGQVEIFVEPAPSALGAPDNVRGRWQISTAGGTMPVWRDDGKELFYVSPDGTMMAAAVDSGHSYFRPGTPKRLFKTTLEFTNARRNYDVTRDGKRFLIEQVAGSGREEPITIVLNWPKLLGR